MHRSTLLLVGALSSGLWSAEARAGETTVAEALFRQGRSLMDEGKYDEACPKFRDSYAQDPAVGTQLNLAACYNAQGKTATAWAEYAAAAAAARDAGQVDRQKLAETERDALEGKLLTVVIRVETASAPADLVVTLDGNPVPASAWNTPMPVDPGPHTLLFSAPGHEPAEQDFDAKERTTEVAAPALVASTAGGDEEHPGQDGAKTSASAWQKPVGWAGIGVGGAGVIAGVITLVLGKSAEGRLADDCVDGLCPPSSQTDIDQANMLQTTSLISFIAGGAFLATGVTLLLTAPRQSEVNNAWRLSLTARGVALGGDF